jgi:hypothetical protein
MNPLHNGSLSFHSRDEMQKVLRAHQGECNEEVYGSCKLKQISAKERY